MYNHSKQKIDDRQLLRTEMTMFNIDHSDDGWSVLVGDELVQCTTISECVLHINAGIKEVKEEMLECWFDLSNLASVIYHNDAGNKGSMENLIFISSVKKAIILSQRFPELTKITDILLSLLKLDVSQIHENLISKFNLLWLRIKLFHKLVMQEMYKLKLLQSFEKTVKMAQVSGPWANLDLPMSERKWEWADGESEYFGNREKARKNQTRYNPETDNNGFYYVWQDLSTHPYSFDKMEEDSPYKTRSLLAIP